MLLALGRLATTGSSELPWTEAETKLADLVAEFGPPSHTSRAQSAAYPFTRLRVDGVWELDQDMPMDPVGPLGRRHVTGRLEASAESALLAKPAVIAAVARDLVLNNFPATVAPDVLQAVGLDPQEALAASDLLPTPPGGPGERTRDPGGGLPFWSLGPAVRILQL